MFISLLCHGRWCTHVGQEEPKLVYTLFCCKPVIKSGMEQNLVTVELLSLLKCVWDWDGNTHVGLVQKNRTFFTVSHEVYAWYGRYHLKKKTDLEW